MTKQFKICDDTQLFVKERMFTIRQNIRGTVAGITDITLYKDEFEELIEIGKRVLEEATNESTT